MVGCTHARMCCGFRAACALGTPWPHPRPPPAGWHQLKHGSRAARSGSAAERRSLGELISLHCQVGGVCTSCVRAALVCLLLLPSQQPFVASSPQLTHPLPGPPYPPQLSTSNPAPLRQVTNSLLGKVAVQSLAPAVLYLGLGLTLLDSGVLGAGPGRGGKGASLRGRVQGGLAVARGTERCQRGTNAASPPAPAPPAVLRPAEPGSLGAEVQALVQVSSRGGVGLTTPMLFGVGCQPPSRHARLRRSAAALLCPPLADLRGLPVRLDGHLLVCLQRRHAVALPHRRHAAAVGAACRIRGRPPPGPLGKSQEGSTPEGGARARARGAPAAARAGACNVPCRSSKDLKSMHSIRHAREASDRCACGAGAALRPTAWVAVAGNACSDAELCEEDV